MEGGGPWQKDLTDSFPHGFFVVGQAARKIPVYGGESRQVESATVDAPYERVAVRTWLALANRDVPAHELPLSEFLGLADGELTAH